MSKPDPVNGPVGTANCSCKYHYVPL